MKYIALLRGVNVGGNNKASFRNNIQMGNGTDRFNSGAKIALYKRSISFFFS